ncbi:ABC transporter permease [Paenibacillus spongiae]|uniref:ABC transporter permease subunit n=1 Tax=Paenibacillus spongiae TaxID=2909671 RepID=A0ABY5SHA3_9BACL|nr:ABC transporter permease subunit [Paenibacillus spongiae]UVI33381.1 ABC transporter permease subunit [Paenibacillus spongiae]
MQQQIRPPVQQASGFAPRKGRLWKEIWKHKAFYLFMLPGVVWFIIFAYIPLYGLTLAFKDYRFDLGMFGSPWAGFKYFHEFFVYYQFKEIIRNTIVISVLKLLIGFPAPILLAILLNEVRHALFKRSVQTISYLPHFISWVVVATLMIRIFTPDGGPVNELMASFGMERVFFMGEKAYFYPMIVLSAVWKGIGFGSIIYLAAIAGIDPQLYEAARIDGAGRFRQILHITLPGLKTVAVTLFILDVGGLMYAGFEQLYLLSNPAVASIGTILDTHVIQSGLKQGRFGYATAAGLFQSVIGLILVLIVNRVSKRVNGVSIW